MENAFKILLLILILVSCKNQSNSGLNKRQLTTRITEIKNKKVQKVEKLKTIPNDLKKLGVFDFFDSDEIIRIWRFPEGGAVFEELIEIKRNGKRWSSVRYTYLIDEFSNEAKFQSFRKKQSLSLKKDEITEFVNNKLLLKNTKPTKEDQICICDMYLSEYRVNNEQKYFEFFLDEKGNNNSAKINLIKFLNRIISE